jgi:hypothetical protein
LICSASLALCQNAKGMFSMKQQVNGIGGVFFRAKNPGKLSVWYKKHLGLPIEDGWGGCSFQWRDFKNPKKTGSTV